MLYLLIPRRWRQRAFWRQAHHIKRTRRAHQHAIALLRGRLWATTVATVREIVREADRREVYRRIPDRIPNPKRPR